MNKQTDPTDDMLLLLALIKEQREAIGDDRKRIEQFYAEMQDSILNKAEKSLQTTHNQAIDALKNTIGELNRATNRLDYKFLLIYSTAFVALVFSVFLALFLFVPSMDEIQQRRAEVTKLKEYSIDLSKCDGQTCVRVMKKQCNYGKNADYCVIDPK